VQYLEVSKIEGAMQESRAVLNIDEAVFTYHYEAVPGVNVVKKG